MYGIGSKGRTRISNIGPASRQQSKEEPEKNLWSSLLDSVASGKKLPEKNLLVLGGNPELQREFLETLESDTQTRSQDRRKKKPPIANEFALGYTYQHVLDADQDDILARLSIFLLSESSPGFSALVKPLLTPKTISETLVIILLDWAEPWSWARQIRDWVRFLKGVVGPLDDDCKIAMEENMKDWQQRRRGAQYEGGPSTANDASVNIPLGSGEWDEPLGLPLCVACHGTEKIEALEKDHGWREEEFDFSLQYLRTVLLKHGSSLIYTSLSVPNSLPTLIHSSLGIHSLLKRQTVKHNVIDRDKVLVPPNWDSWGKIRVLREGFDVEGISSGWSIDIQPPPPPPSQPPSSHQPPNNNNTNPSDILSSSNLPPASSHPTQRPPSPQRDGTILQIYEQTIPSPHLDRPSKNPPIGAVPLETTIPSMQDFLKSAQEEMARLADAEQKAAAALAEKQREQQKNAQPVTSSTNVSTPTRPLPASSSASASAVNEGNARVNEHIGPVQFNMGGIQVDAEEMVRKLEERKKEAASAGAGAGGTGGAGGGRGFGEGTPEGAKKQNEELAQFFAGLMERGKKGSPRVGREREGTPSRRVGGGGGGGGGGGEQGGS
ncbi:MAG: hypothetical protein LQ350_005829 [Teloschistes chrysophthalmus]|nr:MAG: hypothetical protein LQ350_005829 [Niorma chrysophthalma]